MDLLLSEYIQISVSATASFCQRSVFVRQVVHMYSHSESFHSELYNFYISLS